MWLVKWTPTPLIATLPLSDKKVVMNLMALLLNFVGVGVRHIHVNVPMLFAKE